MKIDSIADLHGHYPKLEGGDLLIVAGDLTALPRMKNSKIFLDWLGDQKYKKSIFIAGNHDNDWFFRAQTLINLCNPAPQIEYLCDSGTEFEGLKLWGTPWTKTFPGMNQKCKAFTCDTEEELAVKFELIPEDIDILISHGPPYGILDEVEDRESGKVINTGSSALREAVDRVRPAYLIFGHIHEHGGKSILYKNPGADTLCVNASYVNEHYKPINKPVRIEL